LQPLQVAGKQAQYRISGHVPVSVVDELEVVEVKHHQRNEATSGLQAAVQFLNEFPAVRKLRQLIMERLALELLVREILFVNILNRAVPPYNCAEFIPASCCPGTDPAKFPGSQAYAIVHVVGLSGGQRALPRG